MMDNYKYSVSKKIVKNPMRFVEHITISNSKEDFFLTKMEKVESFDAIIAILKSKEFAHIELIELNQKEFDTIIDLVKNSLEYLIIYDCKCNLFSLNNCLKLKSVDGKYLNDLTSLWNLENNKELTDLELIGCENLSNIEGIKNSSLVNFTIKKDYKTVPNVVNINIPDFSIFSYVKNLKNLTLFVLENENKEKDLKDLAKLVNLEKLYIPREYFTFEQFAWLKSKLVNTSGIGSIYYLAKDPANEKIVAMISGKNQPDWLYDDGTDYKSYQDKFAELVSEYSNDGNPPL